MNPLRTTCRFRRETLAAAALRAVAAEVGPTCAREGADVGIDRGFDIDLDLFQHPGDTRYENRGSGNPDETHSVDDSPIPSLRFSGRSQFQGRDLGGGAAECPCRGSGD